ncbi:MAG: NfeD family protein [Gemmiger sp.]|nr:NfeD family protein [Gemmiger sp.]
MGPDTIFWIVAVVLFGVAEAATTALVSVWFMAGAAVALIISLFTQSFSVQFVVFAGVSAAALAIMLPILAKRRKAGKVPVTNGVPLTMGKRGIVLKAIAPGMVGRVRVEGLDWQATAPTPLPEGSHCTVTGANGGILEVAAVETASTAG